MHECAVRIQRWIYRRPLYIKVYLLLFVLILDRAGREELQSYSIRLLSHPDLASVKNLALCGLNPERGKYNQSLQNIRQL